MTSNLGSQLIHETFEGKPEVEFDDLVDNAKFQVLELLKQTIRPEFLNRIDETIMFLPLTKDNVADIVTIQLNLLKDQLRDKDINLIISEDAFKWIVDTGYDPFFGARPIKRVIQRNVLNELSKALLSGTIDKSKNVVMDLFDQKIVFRKPIHQWEEVIS